MDTQPSPVSDMVHDVVTVRLFNDNAEKENAQSEEEEQVTHPLAELLGYAYRWALDEPRPDSCTLTFSSMLAAMVEGADPLCRWLRRHLALRGVTEQSVTKGRSFDDRSLPTERLNTTVSFRRALAEAKRLRNGQTLDVRHFMAAYAVIPEYHREDFLRLRIDRRMWCVELANELQQRFSSEAETWKAYGARAPAVLLPGFDADLPSGEDFLSLGREVEAFAMLVAGRSTLTPLSIGVFGAWGSGKSYFMERLEERVTELAASDVVEPAANGEASQGAYLKNIAHVRFNAWHYSERNVVASLVENIFRNLHFGRDETDETLAKRRELALDELMGAEDARRRREGELRDAESVEEMMRREVDQARRDADAEVGRKEAALSVAEDKLSAAQTRLKESIEKQTKALRSAKCLTPAREAVALVMGTLLEDETLGRLDRDLRRAAEDARWVGLNATNIFWGAGVLALTTFAVLATPYVRDSKLVTGLVGVVAAATPIVIKWLTTLRKLAETGSEYRRRVEGRAKEAVAKIEAAAERDRAEREQELSTRAEGVEQLSKDIEALREGVRSLALSLEQAEEQREQARQRLDAAAKTVAEKRRQLDSITAGSLLAELVGDLQSTDAYRKELGVLARARTDFERLSDRMGKARKEFRNGKSRPVIERIVLYIDDLDRCPQEAVREILRAVHLLLAFDLFVCVVAVDPRWVIQCLRSSPGVVADVGTPDADLEVLGGAATPSDYLEKIFQIPLWLRPVPEAQRAAVVGALLERHFARDAGATAPGAARPTKDGVASTTPGEQGTPEASGGKPERASARMPAQASAPQPITVAAEELKFLARVAPLLDGNPRALKRFVNTYRLVKASLPDVELEYFAKKMPYRVCMAQLAVLATQRRRARVLVRLTDAALSGAPGVELRLDKWLERLEEEADQLLAGGDRDVAKSLAPNLRDALLPELAGAKHSVEHFAVWLERTRRYSFYL